MKERFEGDDGQRRLRDALRDQIALGGDAALIEKVANAVELRELVAGDALCTQGAADSDVYFILLGAGVEILVEGLPIAAREPGEIIGEMAAIEPSATRSATVRAAGPTVVARLPEAAFNEICESHARVVLTGVARTIARRLRERSKFIRPRAAVPRLFIGSSVEQLPVAEAIQRGFEHARMTAVLWTNSVFKAGSTTIENLTKVLREYDFALFVMTPDDMVTSAGESLPATRDNVLFELGLFMGELGRDRVFGVVPRGVKMRRPSDLFGVHFIDYDATREKDVAVSTVCSALKETMKTKGPR